MESIGLSQKNIYLESMLKPYHTTMYRLNTALKGFADAYAKKTNSEPPLLAEFRMMSAGSHREPLFISRVQRTSQKNIISYQHCLLSLG